MISIVIPTQSDAERLAACVVRLSPGVLAAALKEVIFADVDGDAAVAEIAEATGARLVTGPSDRGARLSAAVAAARGQWIGLLDSGVLLPEVWVDGALAHIGDFPDELAWAPAADGAIARARDALAGPKPGFLLLPARLASAHIDALRTGAEPELIRALGRRRTRRLDFALAAAA